MSYVSYKGKEFKVKKNKLSLKKEGITDISEIEGLESLTNLIELNLSNNKIAEIKALNNLTSLENFNLSRNQISEIKGLEKLTNLKILNLSINPFITKIKGLDNLENLERLDLSFNQIYEIEGLEKLTKLQKLYLWGNEFTKIKGFENLISLKELHLDIKWKHGEFYLNGELIPKEERKKMGRFKQPSVAGEIYVNAQKIVQYCKEKKQS